MVCNPPDAFLYDFHARMEHDSIDVQLGCQPDWEFLMYCLLVEPDREFFIDNLLDHRAD